MRSEGGGLKLEWSWGKIWKEMHKGEEVECLRVSPQDPNKFANTET